YNIQKDVSFCLCCYLFKRDSSGKQGGGDSFVVECFKNWSMPHKLEGHVGGPNSAHNQAFKICEALMNQNQHIEALILFVATATKLALILLVATATVERAFSMMNIVKNKLRNRMRYSWMNDCLVTYIEKDEFNRFDNETIIQRFQNIKTRRGQL
ncbi:DUF4371 domain-containing protein, partial [Cephalotus follicularis]